MNAMHALINAPSAELRYTLGLADARRQAQQWNDAIALYRQLEDQLGGQGAFHHNLALCLLGAGEAAQALEQAQQALAAQPTLWQSAVVKARALKALGRTQEAEQLLQSLCQRHPERGEFALELATLTLHETCDARRARDIVQPWLASPAHAVDAQLTGLMASLYDRDDSAEAVNERAITFARNHLERGAAVKIFGSTPRATRTRRPRMRVGLLSPLFNASPVHFFCIGALRQLAGEFDLYFFSRSRREDWATQQLRALATQWFDVKDLGPDALDGALRQHGLDVLLDLGGWMDPLGLKAISTKPAKRMYKWVGGQSLTTGLRAFDGFISDTEQTPAGYERWFTEPLIRLPQGYVTYTPPPYLPAPVAAPEDALILGIIANPVKVSQPFLASLPDALQQRAAQGQPLVLRFIDKRYHHPQLQARIRAALAPATQALGDRLALAWACPAAARRACCSASATPTRICTSCGRRETGASGRGPPSPARRASPSCRPTARAPTTGRWRRPWRNSSAAARWRERRHDALPAGQHARGGRLPWPAGRGPVRHALHRCPHGAPRGHPDGAARRRARLRAAGGGRGRLGLHPHRQPGV